jgi:hypothetical protein
MGAFGYLGTPNTLSPAVTQIPGPGCFLLVVQVKQTNGGGGSNTAFALVVSDRNVKVSTCPIDPQSKAIQP